MIIIRGVIKLHLTLNVWYVKITVSHYELDISTVYDTKYELNFYHQIIISPC
jgi:hypothetical protein